MKEITLFTDEVMKDMGKRIQDKRRKKGVKAIDFTDIIGIGKDQLSRIENGKVICKTEYLFIISQLLDVLIDYLVFGKKEKSEIFSAANKLSLKQQRKIAQIIEIMTED